MAFRVEDKFEVNAPVDRVWSYLTDPHQVVQCLPGVKLTEVQGDRIFLGTMTTKIGPVSMSFSGRVQMTELNEQEHRVKMAGDGSEGGGWIKGSMTSQLSTTPEGKTLVDVQTEVDIAGRALQFGRSLIQSIMKQQFQKFAECARKHLESPA